MSHPISKLVLDLIVDKLSQVIEGFNDIFNQYANDYGVPPTMAIDFVGVDGVSNNFARANVTPEDWISTSAVKFPAFITLYTSRLVNQNAQKFHQFSGTVDVNLNVFLSWRQGRVMITAFDGMADCVEDAVITIFNRARNSSPDDQEWSDLITDGADVVYNGDVEVQKSRIERGEEFWHQLVSFKFSFEVHARGDV